MSSEHFRTGGGLGRLLLQDLRDDEARDRSLENRFTSRIVRRRLPAVERHLTQDLSSDSRTCKLFFSPPL